MAPEDVLAEPGAVPRVARWGKVWLVFALPLGFALGLVGGFLQESRIEIGAVSLPWASVLVVATLVAGVRALSLNLATRMAGALCYAGWLIASGLLALPNPSGDVVFTAEVGPMAYLLSGCLLGAAASAWPLFLVEPEPEPEPEPVPADDGPDAAEPPSA